MSVMMVCSDGLTFGMTLFVPQTELNIDPQEDKLREPHVALQFPAASYCLQPQQDDDFSCAKQIFVFVLRLI
jgi:hypothetical protein